MSRTALLAAVIVVVAPAALPAETAPADLVAFASAGDVAREVTAMELAMKPGQGFAWRTLVGDGHTVAALEYWKKPARPAVHPDQAEYATVIAGSGTLVSGGSLVEPVVVRPDLTEGSRIVGGTTRKLAPGDVFLISAGVPHWFGIDGDRLVLLGTKIPTRR